MAGRKAGFSKSENQTGSAMGFEQQFARWVDQALTEKPNENIEGFCFNLFQPARQGKTEPRFAVELIGASIFDENDTDWPCAEVFEAKPRSQEIPLSYSGDDWQTCLNRMQKLIAGYMQTSKCGGRALNRARGVGVGFVDGDLLVIESDRVDVS